jgi:hypothetical protein
MIPAMRLRLMHWLPYSLLAVAIPGLSATTSTTPATPGRPPPVMVSRSQNAEMYIRRRWGIDGISVRSISSGSAVEFRYRVVDPDLAAVLNDSKATPTLTDQKSGQKLVVPQMENVGALRQVSKPVAGKEYWMIFQDPHRVVKPRHHVDIAVGVFRLTGLTVE